MSIISFSRQFFLRLLILMALANLAALAAGLTLGWDRAAVENGFVENMQMALILVSMAAAVFASVRSSGLLRVAMAGWAAVNLMMIQREIDFRMFGQDHWLFTLRDTGLRLAFWLPIVALLALGVLRHRADALRALRAVRWRHAWPLAMAGAIMLGSELSEQLLKARIVTNYDIAVFFEELFELNAYCVIAATAVAIAARVRRSGSPDEIAARNRLDPKG